MTYFPEHGVGDEVGDRLGDFVGPADGDLLGLEVGFDDTDGALEGCELG